MSFFNGTVYSETLNMDTNLGVILPQDSRYHRGIIPLVKGEPRAIPSTLILLHGLTDNWGAWAHRTSILSYAEEYGIAVIMPEVQRSFYQDMAYGERYFSYITDELPALVAKMFNIAVDPENLMLAGLSMGGYGALRCGLTYSERYRAIGAFSSVCEFKKFVQNIPKRRETAGFERIVHAMFGEGKEIPETCDLYYLAERAAKAKTATSIFMTCGTGDELYEENQRMYEKMSSLGLQTEMSVWSGIHEWPFWDRSIQKFLQRFIAE